MVPTSIPKPPLSRLTLVTETVLEFTVTEHVAVLPPSTVATMMLAVPAALAITTPEDETVATDALVDDQFTALLVAFDGVTVAVNV